MSSPLLSIIIVAYKSRDEIAAALGSLPGELQQRSVEIFVVDNSRNQDGVGDLIRSSFPWVNLICPEQNLGFGRGNNRGFQACIGEFVLFLNPDTICNVAALDHCIRRLQLDRAIGLISPLLVQADGQMDLACRRNIPTLWDGFCRAAGLAGKFPQARFFAGYNLTYLPVAGTYEVGAINGAFMLGRKVVLRKVAVGAQVFDEAFFMYGDDLDLCIRVARAGFRVVYDGAVQIVHLKGVSVAKEYDLMSDAIFDANCQVYLKHFNPRGSRWIRWKYQLAFGLWKMVSGLKARRRGYRKIKPL